MLISVAFFIARQFPFLIFWPTANKREPKSVVRACVCVLHFLFLFFCCAVERGKWEDSVCTGAEHGKWFFKIFFLPFTGLSLLSLCHRIVIVDRFFSSLATGLALKCIPYPINWFHMYKVPGFIVFTKFGLARDQLVHHFTGFSSVQLGWMVTFYALVPMLAWFLVVDRLLFGLGGFRRNLETLLLFFF